MKGRTRADGVNVGGGIWCEQERGRPRAAAHKIGYGGNEGCGVRIAAERAAASRTASVRLGEDGSSEGGGVGLATVREEASGMEKLREAAG